MEWFYTRDQEPMGPVGETELKDLVRQGELPAEEYCWREGLAEWVRVAQAFPQLVPARKASSAAVAASPSPPRPQVATREYIASTDPSIDVSGDRPALSNRGADNPYARPRSQADMVATAGNVPRRNLEVKRVSVPLWLVLWGMCTTAFIAAIVLFVIEININPNLNQFTPRIGITLALFVLTMVFFFAATVYSYIILYRMWWIIQDPQVRTSPGKAVGFSFIPFFNIYWIFVAYWMWSTDYNQFINRYGLRNAPRMPETLFLLYCIGSLVAGSIPFLGLIIIMVLAVLKTRHAARAVNHFHELGRG